MVNNGIYEIDGGAALYQDGKAVAYFYNIVTGLFETGKAVKIPKGFSGVPITSEQVKAKYAMAKEVKVDVSEK